MINDILDRLFDFDNGGANASRYLDEDLSEVTGIIGEKDNNSFIDNRGAELSKNDSTNISIDGSQ